MKKLIFVLFILLSLGYSGIAQTDRTFYQVCYNSNSNIYPDFNRDEITVNTLTNDSIVFKSGVAYSAKKVTDFNFLESASSGMAHFFAYKVDDNSFFILSRDDFSYYHTDKNRLKISDEAKRCAIDDLKQFDSLVKSFKAKDEEAKKQTGFDSQTKGVTTDYVKNFKSKKIDPALEKGILQWWKGADSVVINPVLHIYFMQPNYEITRDEFNVVLRKTVDAIVLFKITKENKCYIQWRSFGYESLGGGNFDNEVKAWVKQDQVGFAYYPHYIPLTGDRKVNAGGWYEVDCTAFQK